MSELVKERETTRDKERVRERVNVCYCVCVCVFVFIGVTITKLSYLFTIDLKSVAEFNQNLIFQAGKTILILS